MVPLEHSCCISSSCNSFSDYIFLWCILIWGCVSFVWNGTQHFREQVYFIVLSNMYCWVQFSGKQWVCAWLMLNWTTAPAPSRWWYRVSGDLELIACTISFLLLTDCQAVCSPPHCSNSCIYDASWQNANCHFKGTSSVCHDNSWVAKNNNPTSWWMRLIIQCACPMVLSIMTCGDGWGQESSLNSGANLRKWPKQ